MKPMLNIAVRAARNAGDLIVRHVDKIDTLSVTSKQRNDFVSEVDRMAEAEIIGSIRQSYPDHAFHAEESGHSGSSDHVWVIDPLDGTTNFLHGFPVFAVSIALKVKGRLEVGVIYDPMRQELFTATRGGGATLDGRRIRVADRRDLEGSLIGTGFPFRELDQLNEYLAMFQAIIKHAAGIRRPGAAALDLAYVAAGRLDGFWEMGLSEWDIAAGALLIQEAGGLVGDLAGGPTYLDQGNIVAGNQKIFAALVKIIRPHLPASK
ncbi:MAG: inositol monophosphatase family protein [Gammaproteobacteria bacterium]